MILYFYAKIKNFMQKIMNFTDIYMKGNKKYWNDLSKEIKDYCEINNVKYINYFYHKKLVENKKNLE